MDPRQETENVEPSDAPYNSSIPISPTVTVKYFSSSKPTGATATTISDGNSISIGSLTSSLKPHQEVVSQTSEYPASLSGKLIHFKYS